MTEKCQWLWFAISRKNPKHPFITAICGVTRKQVMKDLDSLFGGKKCRQNEIRKGRISVEKVWIRPFKKLSQ